MAGYAYIVLAAALWGMLGPIARLAYQEGVTPTEVAFWRAVLGGAFFLLHTRLRAHTPVARRDWPALVLFGVVGVAGLYGTYQMAVEAGGATLAAVLLYTAPAWVALAGALWMSERFTTLKALAIGLTLAGVALFAFDGGGSVRITAAAVAWGLAAGLCYAFYYPFGKKYFARYEPASMYAGALPLGALLLLPLTTFGDKTALAWAALLAIGLGSTYLAYLAYGAALQRLDATRASIVATLEPVMAGLLAYLWWAERFGWRGYLGAALVLAGVLVTVTRRAKTTPVPSA